MAWLASLAGGVGSAVGGAASGVGKAVGGAASGLASGVGKMASGFHQGVGQGTGMWGGQAGTQAGGAMIKNPMTGGVSMAPQTGWGGVANKLGQLTGSYAKSQNPIGGIDFGAKKSTTPEKKKSTDEMLEELSGRK